MIAVADEHQRTMAFANIALGQIKALRQSASPRHYEVWYTYATGYSPSLNQSINETLARNGTLTEADIESLYETFISSRRFTDCIEHVNSQVIGEIEQIMGMIGAAAGTGSSYSDNLASVSRTLTGADEPAVRAIVESLIQATKDMERNNLALEARLNASKQEINQLQENLEVVRNESLTDPLTSLSNRKFFDQSLMKAVGEACDKGQPLSLLMTDIDHFKKFNDTYGHLTGAPGVAIGGGLAEAERERARRRGALRRRGVRGGAAQHDARQCGDGCGSDPPRGDDQGAQEALHRREPRPGHDLDRCRCAACGRYPAIDDRARRRLPLRRKAYRPQSGDQRSRHGNECVHQGGVAVRAVDALALPSSVWHSRIG
jgi:Diguanylate cyclase, GGDEF domain